MKNGIAIVLSATVFLAFPFARSTRSAPARERATAIAPTAGNFASQDRQDLTLSKASAISSRAGILVQWHTSFEVDNLGFSIYRIRNGQRVRLNHSIIPGSVFVVGDGKPVPGGRSYQWLDTAGTDDAVYSIESEDLNGNRHSYQPVIQVSRGKLPDNQVSAEAVGGQPASLAQNLREYPAAITGPEAIQGSPDPQWAVAGQSGLKIRINHDGWYRVTQQQMSAAGFTPTVDIKNLSVFADGVEIAIKTSKASGPLTIGDYLEFYGRGLDTPDTDTRIYYLIAGSQPGKRSPEDLATTAPQLPAIDRQAVQPLLNLDYATTFIPLSELLKEKSAAAAGDSGAPPPVTPTDERKVENIVPLNNQGSLPGTLGRTASEKAPPEAPPVMAPVSQPATANLAAAPQTAATGKKRKTVRSRKSQRRRTKSKKPQYGHALSETTASSLTFDYTVQLRERYSNGGTDFPVYFTKALNGEGENWFGRVVSSLPADQTIPVHNHALTADTTAHLVVALQGVLSNNPNHQVNVFVNSVMIGTVSFFGIDHAVQTFNVPLSQLQEGNNTVRCAQSAANDTSIVDYLTLTYPHTYQAFNDSLLFTARAAQTLQVDGFSTPNVQLLDISDPTAVQVTQPVSVASGSGYAITVPPGTKKKARTPRFGAPELQIPRTLYALPQGQFDTPAGFSLNQPSFINQSSNSADLLILSYKDFIPSLAPLVAKRSALPDALTVKVVDVEDVYDEFSYGAHDHHAIKKMLLQAMAVWTKHPRYLLLVGDASYDPRNYEALPRFAGDFGPSDFVPTNLIDTLFGEACSDEVLADFDNDGIAEVAVGRLPAGSVAQADLMLSKIVNFSKFTGPQTALFVADNAAETGYYFNFDTASDELIALLPTNLSAQKIYRSTQSTCAARTNVINSINQGVALVNYSGHGNVNVWAGTCVNPPNPNKPFFGNADAQALANQNRLPLVLVANCLNGLFNAPTLEGLAELFLKNSNGGGVAVYASSGETIPDGQQQMNIKLYQTLFGGQSVALGDVTKIAKAATFDLDVRRSWILLGDPSMKVF